MNLLIHNFILLPAGQNEATENTLKYSLVSWMSLLNCVAM